MFCHFPVYRYQWLKNGVPLQLSDTMRMPNTDGTLFMTNLTSADEGYYQCSVTNVLGHTLSKRTYLQQSGGRCSFQLHVVKCFTFTHFVFYPAPAVLFTRMCPTYTHMPMGVWASCQIRKIAGCACAGNAGNVFPRHRLQRKPLVSDPGMHHGTCVTHVPWCMSGSLTRGGGEKGSRHSRCMHTRKFGTISYFICLSICTVRPVI